MREPSSASIGRRRTKTNNVGRNGHRRYKPRTNRGYNSGRNKYYDYNPPETQNDGASILGGRRAAYKTHLDGPPDAFGLFCAFHLGITPEDGYKKPSMELVAKRYNLPPEEIEKLLTEFRIDSKTIEQSGFDIESAQVDIRLAPTGISRTETARDLFEEYLALLD